LAERAGAHAALVEVVASEKISPSLQQIDLAHPNIAQLAGVAGNDVMVRVQRDDGQYVRRRYSVRSVDERSSTLRLWVSTAHQGAGAQWANSVRAGDVVDLIGPRGKILLDEMADWHLFVGDVTALASFYRLAENVESPGRVIFVVELDTIDDALTPHLDEAVAPTGIFVERQGRAQGDPSALLSALSAFEFPPDEGHAYLFGEFATMRSARVALEDRGLAPGAIDLKAFWRAGTANAEHGEPPKDEN
jgi:NADPH-dependent ferric siderophore reductase